MTFVAVSFQDGLVSVDKLQRMSDNDDYLYNAALGKPRGLVALEERTTDYVNAAGSTFENLFNDVTVLPYANNRLLALFVFIPWYASTSAGILASSTLQIVKNGLAIQMGYTDKKFYSGAPHGDQTSFFQGCLDIRPELQENVYNVQIKKNSTGTTQLIDLSASRPAQFWIEDLGEI